jgi:hypothetical protein
VISDADLKEFIAQWNTTSGVTILRADQSVKMPSYPYATYKELSTNVEPWVSNIKTRSYNPTDKIVTITENETSETTISVNVFSDKHAEAKQKIEILRFALKTNAVNKKASDLNMSIILNITNVQDRTIFLESNYEYRFGFDFILRATTPQVETFNSIEEINGTITTTNEITENTNTFEVTG